AEHERQPRIRHPVESWTRAELDDHGLAVDDDRAVVDELDVPRHEVQLRPPRRERRDPVARAGAAVARASQEDAVFGRETEPMLPLELSDRAFGERLRELVAVRQRTETLMVRIERAKPGELLQQTVEAVERVGLGHVTLPIRRRSPRRSETRRRC